MSNLLDDTGHFHFHDLEMTPKGHSRSKVMTHVYQVGNGEYFVYRHPGPRSNRLDYTGHLHFHDLEMTPKGQSRSKVKTHFY